MADATSLASPTAQRRPRRRRRSRAAWRDTSTAWPRAGAGDVAADLVGLQAHDVFQVDQRAAVDAREAIAGQAASSSCSDSADRWGPAVVWTVTSSPSSSACDTSAGSSSTIPWRVGSASRASGSSAGARSASRRQLVAIAAAGVVPARPVQRLAQARRLDRLEQVVDGAHVERRDRVRGVGGAEDHHRPVRREQLQRLDARSAPASGCRAARRRRRRRGPARAPRARRRIRPRPSTSGIAASRRSSRLRAIASSSATSTRNGSAASSLTCATPAAARDAGSVSLGDGVVARGRDRQHRLAIIGQRQPALDGLEAGAARRAGRGTGPGSRS